MTKIYNWTVERSGAGLRVIGVDAAGDPVKLTKVIRVATMDGVVFAVRDTTPVESAVLA